MTSLLTDFMRATRGYPCPVCGRKKYCMLERASPHSPARVLCTKTESAHRWGEAGWLHCLKDEPWRHPLFARTRRVEVLTSPALDFPALAATFHAAVDRVALSSLCVGLGLSAGALQRLSVGWASRQDLERLGTTCSGAGAWVFPMVSGAGQVIGLRLRLVTGCKFAVPGSKQGIFVPANLSASDRLLLAEGPTDAAALLDLGFPAAGRPSCSGGARHCVALVRRLKPGEVVVVSDADEPGRKGAADLATVLRAYTPCVKVIRPPEGVKDARAWKCTAHDQAAIARQVEEAIDAALPVASRVRVEGHKHA